MGGSQLKQLKAAISTSGVVQSQSNSRKRKRGSSNAAGRGAVLEHRDERVEKLREIHEKFNPFDVKVEKVKHDVGGRKVKGTIGKPGASKQAGIEQRKKTLLVEYELKDKAGGVVDRRLGENDPTMSLEERMLARFTKERQRSSKGVLYNLEDEDELTHYGRSLSKLDDFDNVGLNLGDEEEEDNAGQIDSATVKSAHFLGFSDDDENDDEDGPPRKKTKGEVMAEVIAKSKEHKYARQLQREQDESTRHTLDADFDSIRGILFSKPDSQSIPPLPIPPVTVVSTTLAAKVATDRDYDLFVRELAMDKRAQPKDRTKTEEEIALEEKEALELSEKKRLRRMMGEQEDSEDEAGVRTKRRKGGDDLDDDFILEDDTFEGIGAGLKGEGDEDAEEEGDEEEDDEMDGEEDDEDEEDEEGSGGPDSDGESQEYGPSDEGEEAEEGIPEEVAPVRPKKAKKPSARKPTELPFTFPCPATHDEFLDIVENVEDDSVGTVVERIRKLHHPSLHAENKSRLQTFTGVILDHIIYSASLSPPSFTIVEALIPHLYVLAKAYPITTAEKFISKLNLLQKNFTRGLQDPLDPSSKTFPGLAELVFLRVLGATWSTSDMKHTVVGLARYLMGAYLGLGRVRDLKDVASGLAVCSLFMQYEELSKRLVPEVVNFVVQALLLLCPVPYTSTKAVPGYFPVPDFEAIGSSLRFRRKRAGDITPASPSLFSILVGEVNGEQAKLDLISLSLELIGRCADTYKPLDGFIELYEPILTIVTDLSGIKLPQYVLHQIAQLKDKLSRLLKFAHQARQPLLLQAHKPIPIATYIPKFDAHSSSYMRNKDPNAEREALSKLKARHRKEKKGAIRELRKDNRFLAGVQQEQQEAKDREYKARMAKAFAGLESERAEQRKEDNEKRREKRRSGRK